MSSSSAAPPSPIVRSRLTSAVFLLTLASRALSCVSVGRSGCRLLSRSSRRARSASLAARSCSVAACQTNQTVRSAPRVPTLSATRYSDRCSRHKPVLLTDRHSLAVAGSSAKTPKVSVAGVVADSTTGGTCTRAVLARSASASVSGIAAGCYVCGDVSWLLQSIRAAWTLTNGHNALIWPTSPLGLVLCPQ